MAGVRKETIAAITKYHKQRQHHRCKYSRLQDVQKQQHQQHGTGFVQQATPRCKALVMALNLPTSEPSLLSSTGTSSPRSESDVRMARTRCASQAGYGAHTLSWWHDGNIELST
mmetsp:Transcript_15793/g.43166  ORF Transcript_15793/g.43166 Transcript_15793/m.43166 type:complete len:114 (-) Transcript_15793:2-343(-)